MEHIYHKGKYRSGEWWKHLRPFLKRVGNKRWRKDGKLEIATELECEGLITPYRKRRRKHNKQIKVKFSMESAGGFKHSYHAYYKSLKAANDAIKRNEVTSAIVFKRKGVIIGTYEKRVITIKKSLKNGNTNKWQ